MNPLLGPAAFPSTRWTLIRSAQASPEARRAALSELMRTYWRPLYVFLRAKGLDPTAAQDAVQDVWAQVLERDVIDKVAPERGRLRGYLKTMAMNHLANRHEAATAQKRGGGAVELALDTYEAERLVHAGASPDATFDQEWAASVMDRAMKRLEAEYVSGARKGPWALVRQAFAPNAQLSYRDLAAAHGMSLPQLKSFLHRARERFRELLKEEVRDTLDENADAEGELNELLRVLAP